MTKTLARLALGLLGFAIWLAVWEWSTVAGPLAGVRGLATAGQSLAEAVRLTTDPDFWQSVAQTFMSVSIAMALAIVVGIVVGVAMGSSTVVQALLDPLTQFLRPIPPVVILPLILLLVGPTIELAVLLAVAGAVWPILIQAQVGVRDVDPVAVDTARAMSLSPYRTQTAIVLPSALPYFATGVRIAASLALMLTIGAGILGGAPGLGRTIIVAQETGDAARVFGLLIWAGVLGVGLSILLGWLESALSKGRRVEEL